MMSHLLSEDIAGAPFFLLVALLLFFSCNEKRSVNREAISEEMKNREIKKVSEEEILRAGLETGSSIAALSQKTLLDELKHQISKNDSLESVLSFCQTNAYPLIDTIAKSRGATLKRVSLKTRNKKNDPDEIEHMLLDAYAYNVENDLPLNENIQNMDEKYLLFTQPITISSPTCLRCHGEIGTDISPGLYKAIKELYPEDDAYSYAIGDFRGMWSVKLSKKELIKGL